MDLLTGFRLRTSYSNESHKPAVRHFLTWIFQNSHCLLPIFRLERTQEKSTNRAWDSILPFDSTFDIWIACMLVGFYVHSQQASESYGPHLLWFDLPFTVQCDFRIASVLLSPTRSWKHCWPWDTASQSCKKQWEFQEQLRWVMRHFVWCGILLVCGMYFCVKECENFEKRKKIGNGKNLLLTATINQDS